VNDAWAHFVSPIGLIRAEAGPRGLLSVRLVGAPSDEAAGAGWEHVQAFLDFAERYFAGEPARCEAPLDLSGASPVQVRLWRYVQDLPYGRTTSYAALGRELGLHPRAVGAGLRSVPFLLVVPAHRVIHADGRVGGFAGMEGVKAWLIEFERVNSGSGTS